MPKLLVNCFGVKASAPPGLLETSNALGPSSSAPDPQETVQSVTGKGGRLLTFPLPEDEMNEGDWRLAYEDSSSAER